MVSGAAAGSRPVTGKRGAWTQAGVTQTADGDPAAAWYGQYALLDVTEVLAVMQAGGADAATASVVPQPDRVYIYNDPQFGLTFQWGNRYGGNVTYNNNVLQCADEDDDTTRYVMQFTAPQAGAAEINLVVTTSGVVRSYKGYWVDVYAPPSPASSLAPQARLAKRPMTAVYHDAAAGASSSRYSQAIDVSTLAPDPKPNKIALPYGAVGNNYALTLSLTNCASTDKFSWALKPGSGKNDATGRAAIAGNNQTVLFSLNNLSDSDAGDQLLVTVELTNNSAGTPATYTLLFDIAVIQCNPISLAPPMLMPVVVGATYTQSLVAHGARENFTWSDPNPNKDPTKGPYTSLPPGLTWDPDNRQLSGTVTDATQVGKAFSLTVEVAPSDVILDALTVSLAITVQSAPEVASGMDSWEKIFISAMTASGLVLAALAAFGLNRYKAAKENAKTIDTLKAGKKNVDDATNGDPKGAGKSIVEKENATVPALKDNITYNQSLINEVFQQQKDLKTKIEQNQGLIDKLAQYLQDPNHKRDNWEADVTDPDLVDAGYGTLGEAIEGLDNLRKSNAAAMEMLSAAAQRSNHMTANTVENQNQISDNDQMKPNEDLLS